MISKRPRWSGVASASRQDHTKGTLTTRPSASWATMESSVTSNATIRGSLSAAVLIPGLRDAIQIIEKRREQFLQLKILLGILSIRGPQQRIRQEPPEIGVLEVLRMAQRGIEYAPTVVRARP